MFVCNMNLLHIFEFNNVPTSCSGFASLFSYNQLTEMFLALLSDHFIKNTTNSKLIWHSFLFSSDLTTELQHKPKSVTSSCDSLKSLLLQPMRKQDQNVFKFIAQILHASLIWQLWNISMIRIIFFQLILHIFVCLYSFKRPTKAWQITNFMMNLQQRLYE